MLVISLHMSVCLYSRVPIPDMEAQVESQGQGLPNGMAIWTSEIVEKTGG